MTETWTTERVSTLRELRDARCSASEIGAAIGLTRNAVLGKLRRLQQSKKSVGAPLTLIALTNATCRWPLGETVDGEATFCGARTTDLAANRPYCPIHHALAYKPRMAPLRPRDMRAGTAKAPEPERVTDLVEAFA